MAVQIITYKIVTAKLFNRLSVKIKIFVLVIVKSFSVKHFFFPYILLIILYIFKMNKSTILVKN